MAKEKKKVNSQTPEQQPAGSPGRQRSNEEQMQIRQSAPQPSMLDEANRIQMEQAAMMMGGQGIAPDGAVDGFRALAQPIGKEAVQKATLTLQKYKEGKANLERRVIEDEQWYKMRHWECMRKKEKHEVEPTSGWLFNCIANKHADAMDNYPQPNILPREEGDKGEAEMLTSIIPVILDQNDFENTYSEVTNYKLKTGTGIYGIFWDGSKLNGLGDISIRKVDIINLFWQSGISDIQQSRNVFHVELADNDVLDRQYPQLKGKLGRQTIDIAKYVYDDSVDTTDKSVVVDWYYKKPGVNGKTILHYCKFCNDTVLFATENDPQYADRGFYDHGKYPFIFDVLFPVEGTPCGFGYIDIGKSSQEYIDRGNQAIMQNMLFNARPRHFIRSDGSVNEEEYADVTKDFIHVDGNLGADSIMPVSQRAYPLSATYVQVINNKIDELKETTGNRDISTGGTTSGVTAASAIAAMQEASSKLSRDSNKAAFRVFRNVCLMCIELIRQFYDLPRCFRIMGVNGAMRFVYYSNQGLVPQQQGADFGIDMGMRIPLFDVEISAQKQSPYSKMSQNELALQFYQIGFFNPMMADQALMCLDMMDFPKKDTIMQKIAQGGGMMRQMMMLGQLVDAQNGTTEVTDGLAAQFGLPAPSGQPDGGSIPEEGGGESNITKNARANVNKMTEPS